MARRAKGPSQLLGAGGLQVSWLLAWRCASEEESDTDMEKCMKLTSVANALLAWLRWTITGQVTLFATVLRGISRPLRSGHQRTRLT